MDGSETIGNGGAFNLDFGSSSDTNRASSHAIEPNFGRGNADDNNGDFDPGRHAGRDKRNRDGSYRLKRGRKPGSGGGSTRRASTPSAVSVEALTNVLMVVHAGFASMTKTPEMNIDKDDAKTLGMASAHVLDQFDIIPDPKVTAIVGLVMACGQVYGPKLYLIRERRKEEKAAKKDEEPQAQPLRFSSVRVDG